MSLKFNEFNPNEISLTRIFRIDSCNRLIVEAFAINLLQIIVRH